MRIIAGEYGGRKLRVPRGLATRPTADRVKEAVFNILGRPQRREGSDCFRVLDLYAGTGALGLEALSRGADEAVLVEQDRDAVAALERNVEELKVGERARVIEDEVGAALRRRQLGAFDWIFLDPPYGGGALERALRIVGGSSVVAPGGLVIAEHDAHELPADRHGRLVLEDRRAWGQTQVSFYRLEEP